MLDSSSEDSGSGPAACAPDTHGDTKSTKSSVVDRLSRYGMQVMPGAPQRRSRLQRQGDVPDSLGLPPREAPERNSLTPAMRKKYLKELLLNGPSQSGFSSVLSAHTFDETSTEPEADWALYPMEHAWMLNAVEGNYATILEFISAEPYLLSKKDFISGYSVLHWLAKRGQSEVLVKLLRYAQSSAIPVNVNLRGSGGLTPLHVASMHRQYMVVKLLVGAFGANVDAMDYNGKKAWQYLEGDAPLEMKELLGTWDEQPGSATNANKNVNNGNSCDSSDPPAREEEGGEETCEVVGSLSRTRRRGNWMFGSLRKLLPSFTSHEHRS